jgi:hypothetical protein
MSEVVGFQLAQDRGHWPQTSSGTRLKPSPSASVHFSMDVVLADRDIGCYRKVLCRASARRRRWRMSTKGGGLTVTRKEALGHGINKFVSPLAAMSRKIRTYLALLNHQSLRATHTYENLISWNSNTVASTEIKVVRVLD